MLRSCCALLFAGMLCAEHLPVRMYTTADGLPSNDILRMVRDSRGLLWFCTAEGLARLDGSRFLEYGPEQGLPFAVVFDVAETRGGTIWVGTHGALAEFRAAGEPRFKVWPLGDDGKLKSIRRIFEDRAGSLWVGAFEGLFERKEARFGSSEIGMPTSQYAGEHVTSLLEDRHGVLWVGARSGLYRRFPDGRIEHFTEHDGLPALNVPALLEDRRGRIWIGTRGGLWMWDGPKCRVFSMKDGFPGQEVLDLLETSEGRIYAALKGGVAEIRDGGVMAWRREQGLPHPNCTSLAEDLAGNLWVGTESGAARIARSGFRTYTDADGLGGRHATVVFAGSDGELVAATRKDEKLYLHRFDGLRFQSVRPWLPPSIVNEGWSEGQIVLRARDGEWWVATGSGLCRYGSTARIEDLAAM